MPTVPLTTRRTWAGLLLLLVATWLAYRPGLAGGFLFDDYVNLDALGRHGAIDDWAAFWRYITSGLADPTGRPLSLLTFLLDARNWPADPRPFLRTNLLLHLANGALLFALLRSLGRHLDGRRASTDAAALFGTGIWLLHPLFVSTTLYVVQREAMLPATFVLMGLIAYVHGRSLLASRPRTGLVWILAGIGLGTLLAVLSKANGALLPLLALVLEATVLRAGDREAGDTVARRLRRIRWTLLLLPTLILVFWLLWRMPPLGADLAHRPWTMGERLLTQPRVLLDYLQLLAVPRVLSTGLYNDSYAVSTGWLQPASTLAALLAILLLLGGALAMRRRAPVLAAALLFWFAGHVMESSVVALELYYEHRNYLPAMLLSWPLARALTRWRVGTPMRMAAAVAVLALLASLTWQRATLWGQPQQMAMLWAARSPESPRAHATAAAAELQAGHAELAVARLAPLAAAAPDELQFVLGHARAACFAGSFDATTEAAVEVALRTASDGYVMAWNWLGAMMPHAETGSCPGLDSGTLHKWIEALAANPKASARPARQQDVHALRGRLALMQGLPDHALSDFNRALEAWPRPQAAGEQATRLAAAGHYRQALAHLDHYEVLARADGPPPRRGMAHLHQHVLERQGFWPRQLAELRGKLNAELGNRETGSRQPRGSN